MAQLRPVSIIPDIIRNMASQSCLTSLHGSSLSFMIVYLKASTFLTSPLTVDVHGALLDDKVHHIDYCSSPKEGINHAEENR